MKTTLQAPIRLSATTVDVKMNVAIDGHYWDVEGVMDIKTREFTPQIIGVFSIEQFASESKNDLAELQNKLQDLVTKNIGW